MKDAAPLVHAASAYAIARLSCSIVDAAPKRARQLIERRNYRGEVVSLSAGVGAITALTRGVARALGTRAAFAGAAVGVAGLLDDVVEPLLSQGSVRKGLRGHIGALTRGEVTTGSVKIGVIGLGALGLAHQARSHGTPARIADAPRLGELAGFGRDSLVIAASANLINLFDLRPGRALKVCGALLGMTAVAASAKRTSSPAARVLAAHSVGTILALAPGDLRAQRMLGDSGANTLGAVAGTMMVLALTPRARTVAFITILALTLASERVSFSRVIESSTVLSRLDRWGRTP